MTYSAQELYELLPAVYRLRDADLGQPLLRLVGVLAEQAEVMDRDIAQLYENWFIETCEPWVVPYIGDLLQVGVLSASAVPGTVDLPVLPGAFSQRAFVANSIRYRRRKGTPAVLEQVAFDVSGWPARVVEYFQLLATTQYVKHVRLASQATADLRDGRALERVGSPFDTFTRTAEVRPLNPPAGGGSRTPLDLGRFNIPNAGVCVCRLQPYRVVDSTAWLVASAEAGFTFSPLGLDAQLFNPPRTEVEVTHLAEERDLPLPLRRRQLFDEVEGARQAILDGESTNLTFFSEPEPVFRIAYRAAGTGGAFTPVLPEEFAICDLSTWRRPASSRSYVPTGGGSSVALPVVAGVDPELGRITFAGGIDAGKVQVSYSYGFSGDMGGGPYDQQDAFASWLDASELTFVRGVTQDSAVIADAFDPSLLFPNLREAVDDWNAYVAGLPAGGPGPRGLILMMDSGNYAESLTGPFRIEIPAGARLAIASAGWPQQTPPESAPIRVLAPGERLRPHLRGDVEVRGGAAASDPNPGELIVQGMLIEGGLEVAAGNLGSLRLIDTTLVPGAGELVVNGGSMIQGNSGLLVRLHRSICSGIELPDPVPHLEIYDSIVDGAGNAAITAPSAAADLQRCTLFGAVDVSRLEASDVIFVDPVTSSRTQVGCVRFSHVPAGSKTPRRFRCQPDLALTGVKKKADRARIRSEMGPDFTSESFGEAAYAQLARVASPAIRAGGSNGGEMGGFNTLLQPQREADLRSALAEYLRFGLEVGIEFVT